jgi:hypothetical protein
MTYGHYRDPVWTNRESAVRTSAGSDAEASEAIVALALNDTDGEFLETFLTDRLRTDSSAHIRQVCLVGIGHLARRFRRRLRPDTLDAVRELLTDPMCGGYASDAMSDIQMFSMP